MKSDVFGISWPALKINEAAMLSSLVGELRATQWLKTDEIKSLQHRQLVELLLHHNGNTPSFANRLVEDGLTVDDMINGDGFRNLRPITRSRWQDLGQDMFSTKIPSTHGKPTKLMTSGSTGEPVVTYKTMINGLFWAAHSVLDHEWHHRDVSLRMISIRADIPREAESPNWGYPMARLHDTGPARGLPITTDVAKQEEIMLEFKPEFMITYPNNLSALLDIWELGYRHNLKHIKTVGETVTDQLRHRTRVITGLEIEDGYSSNELGTIAMHCGHAYHTMDDSLIVEVLDEEGDECQPGEIGRVVLTDIHNFATPVIRYEIGDYAERGHTCPCGRGYGTLNRIMGRQRNLIRNPDGTTHWPLTGFYGFRDVADIKQYQMIQHDHRNVELKLVVAGGLSTEQELLIKEMVRSALKHEFEISLTVVENPLPRGKNGKFEEFICRIQ